MKPALLTLKTPMNLLLDELKKYKIAPEYNFGRIELSGGDNTARGHYSKVIKENPKLEAELILDLARHDKNVLELLEERVAIRQADGLSGGLEAAVMANLT